jgi:hypothetical protein
MSFLPPQARGSQQDGTERRRRLQDVGRESRGGWRRTPPLDCSAPRRPEGCFCDKSCEVLGYCPSTYGVGWPD